jgi:hypothetical protein
MRLLPGFQDKLLQGQNERFFVAHLRLTIGAKDSGEPHD